jgi:SulP family sulfate permease
VISDSLTGIKHSSDQELIGHGIANIASPLFGGIASTGSIARTVTSVKIGNNCPIAGLACAAALCVVIRFLAPLAKFIPLAVLSAILFVVAVRMMNHRHFYDLIVHAPKSDAAILILTFALTLFCGIVVAVNVGIMLTALMLMHRMADSSHVDRVKKAKPVEYDFSQLPDGIAVYSVVGPIFFGMIDKFSKAISSAENDDRVVIMRMFDVPFIDATGLENLRLAFASLKKRGKILLLSEATEAVMAKLRRSRSIDGSALKFADKSIIDVVGEAHRILHG